MSTAYALREAYDGTVVQYATQEDKDADRGVEVPAFTGGVISAGDRDVDVRELLDGTDYGPAGRIVVDDADAALVTALDEYPPLKRVDAGDASETADADAGDGLEQLKAADLRRIAGEELGLDGVSRASKPALITAIRSKRELIRKAATGSEADKLRASEADTLGDALEHDDQAGGAGEED